MRTEQLNAIPNTRPPGSAPSQDARLLLFDLQARGFAVVLSDDRRRVRVLKAQRLTADDRTRLAREFHGVRDLLRAERPS